MGFAWEKCFWFDAFRKGYTAASDVGINCHVSKVSGRVLGQLILLHTVIIMIIL